MLTLSWGNISVFGVSRLLPVLFKVIFVFRVVCVSRWVEISCIPVPCKRNSVVCLPQSYAVIVKRENTVGSVLAVPAKNHRAVIQFCRNRGSCASADASMFNVLVGIFVSGSMDAALIQKKDADELDYNTGCSRSHTFC